MVLVCGHAGVLPIGTPWVPAIMGTKSELQTTSRTHRHVDSREAGRKGGWGKWAHTCHDHEGVHMPLLDEETPE